jgi:hypothetical protein
MKSGIQATLGRGEQEKKGKGEKRSNVVERAGRVF